MHDCRKIKSKIVDLLFDEARRDEKLRIIAEIDGCDDCLELYRSMTETLKVFDAAVEAGLPAEDYWQGYENRLRARLDRQSQPVGLRLLVNRMAEHLALFASPLKVAVAILILTAALWLAFFRGTNETAPGPEVEAKRATPSPTPVPQQIAPVPVAPKVAEHEMAIQKKPRRKGELAPDVSREARGGFEARDKQSRRPAGMVFLSADAASHIEKTEMLLRAFRNLKPSDDEASFDVSYEKHMSRELVATNMLLRRRAASKENSAARELLASVEPILLDIANMPERATEGDVRAVKELIRKQEIIPALQFYSAKALSQVLNRENYDSQ
ncbi:MAG TPA: hypothetical protein VLD57_04905 [Blastocatellia bacterium]|nr:hypothetical protein [Blastocatellia bacterium]